jgi:hypothetical protein
LRTVCLALMFALLVAVPQASYAQAGCTWASCARVVDASTYPVPTGEGTRLDVLGMNMALGAATAAVVAVVRRRPVVKAAALGALGGSVTYMGKSLASQKFDGAGLLGRQVGAVGASITRDAVEGHDPFRRVVLPLGVVRLHMDADAEDRVRVRADLASIAASVAALAQGGDLDLSRSLSSGTPVFKVSRESNEWNGIHLAGVIWLRDDLWYRHARQTISHEMVHVVQHDASFIAWAEPLERATFGRIPGFRFVHRWTDFGLQVPFRALGNTVLTYEDRPWEWEAGVLSGTGRLNSGGGGGMVLH